MRFITCSLAVGAVVQVLTVPGLAAASQDFGDQQQITTAADRAVSVYATDLDGDGDADVLSASANDDKIAWYENLMGRGPIGANYCGPANVNSSGSPGVISGFGSLDVPDNDLDLTCSQLPAGKFALFVVSQTQGFSTPANSQGNLCLSGNIGRHRTQLGTIDNAGMFTISVDLTNVPVNPPVPVMSGETWNWQLWFQDNNPGSTSNFTDGLSITFN